MTSIATCLRTAVCAQQPHGVATVYDRKTGEIRGGGSPSHLSHHGFRADARSPITDTRLKREGGTFHFGLRRFRNSYLALAVPTRVRLTLPHAIWLTSFAILSVSGGEQKGNPRISIHTDRPLQDDQPTPAPSTSSCFLGRVSNTKGLEGASPLAGRRPRLQCAWTSSGTAPEREARTNDCVPFVQYPTYDRSYHTSQSAHSIVGTTRRQRMRRLSGLAWPPLL